MAILKTDFYKEKLPHVGGALKDLTSMYTQFDKGDPITALKFLNFCTKTNPLGSQ